MLASAFSVSVLVLGQAPTVPPLEWQNELFTNEFWVLDHVADWEHGEGNEYKSVFEQRGPVTEQEQAAIRAYAAVRRAHVDHDDAPPDVKQPVKSMLPPKVRPEERLAVAFLNAPDEVTACASAKLDAAETKTVVDAFKTLRPKLDAMLEGRAFMPAAMEKLRQAAERSKLTEFVASMAAFYGIRDERPFRVHMLWAPPHFGTSTVWDHDVLLTVASKTAADEKDLLSWLGVVVHELGHSFLSAVSLDEAAELSRRMVDSGGLVNQRHHNIIDEATQTALGNIVFVRDRLPEAFDRGSFYSYEPKNAYPDAIDSLARELEPLVTPLLGKERAFATTFLPKALDAQHRLFGDTPLQHSHVALVFNGDTVVRHDFDGLFWGVSRFNFDPATAADFAAASHENGSISRWVLLTTAQATEALLGTLALPDGLRVTAGPGARACARAKRRSPTGSYDVLVVGRDDEALRLMLIALHRATLMPEAQPLCVRAAK